MNKFQFRKANVGDRKEVIELLVVQLREHSITTPLNKIEKAIDGIFENKKYGELFVSLVDSKIVGVACLSYIWTIEHGGHSSWLEELYLKPEYRNQGIGSKFLEFITEYARSEKCTAIDLEVESDHAQVERLYARHGFRKHTRSHWVKQL